MAALLRAEQVTRTADLEIPHRQRKARAHARKFLDRAEPPGGRAREVRRLVDEHVAIRAVMRPADAAPQLVQVGEAVGVGLVDEDRVGVGDVEPTLDDRRRQEDLRSPLDEVDHHVLELGLREPAVADPDRGVGDELLDPVRHEVDVVDPIVDEEHLAAAGQLAIDRMADHRRIPPRHARLHGQSIRRRRRQAGDVANPEHRHVERARDRRRRHRQHVDARPEGLEPLLDVDAEALLLVDDQEPEVVEVNVGLGDSMGADDDIDGASGEPLERLPLLSRRTKPRQRPDGEGKLGEAGSEAPPVLLAKDGGGDEDGHLMARFDRLERRPHRHLGLPEADVAAQQPVHRAGPFHVGPDRVGRRPLIRSGIEREGVGELPLPGGVGGEGDAGAALPLRLELDHVGGHVGDRLTDRLLLLLPQLATHLGELRRELAAADILLHQLDGGGGDVDPRRLGELEVEIFLRPPLLLEQPQALVAPDAVSEMDDVVPFVEIEERVDRPREALPRGPRRDVFAAEELGA